MAALLLAGASLALPLVRPNMGDFEVDWRAGARWTAAEPLYRVEDGHYQFKYLPVFGAAMAPLSWLPLKTAKSIWFDIVIASLIGSVWLSWRLLPSPKRSAHLVVPATVVVMAKFFAHEANLGQFNAVMLLAVLAGFFLIEQQRPVWGGLFLVAAVVDKPYAVVFLPYLLVAGREKSAVAFIVGLAIALLAPVTVYGWAGNADLLRGWARTVSETTAPNLLNQDNVSIAAMYAKWIGTGVAAFRLTMATMAALGVTAVLVLWKGRGRPRADYLEMALLLLLVPLCSPQGWDYVLLLATPAVMLIIDRLPALSPPIRATALAALAIIAFSIFDIMGRRAYAEFMALSVISVCALVLVGLLAYARFRGLA